MEKEHLIIIAILGVILYMCMTKSEGFNYEEIPFEVPPSGHVRYQVPPGPVSHIRQGGPCGDGSCPQHIRTDAPLGVPTGGSTGGSDMNIMYSQYITNHIRSNRRNNMMNSMMYGYKNPDPANCGESGCA